MTTRPDHSLPRLERSGEAAKGILLRSAERKAEGRVCRAAHESTAPAAWRCWRTASCCNRRASSTLRSAVTEDGWPASLRLDRGPHHTLMKIRILVLFVLCCSRCGCDRRGDATTSHADASEAQMKTYDEQTKIYNEQLKQRQAQMDAYERQSKGAEEHLRAQAELQKRADEMLRAQEDVQRRYDALLTAQEQLLKRQQDNSTRFEKILDRWESQQKQYQKYLDSLSK